MLRKVRPAFLPRHITKLQLYELCIQHGKLIIGLELRDRHGAAVKDGNISEAISMRRMIFSLEDTSEAQMRNYLAAPPTLIIYRITPEPTLEEVRARRNQETLEWIESQSDDSSLSEGNDLSDAADDDLEDRNEIEGGDNPLRYGDLIFGEEWEIDDAPQNTVKTGSSRPRANRLSRRGH